jgi:DNA-directed RNA polymerase subunit RPC12/RpoP
LQLRSTVRIPATKVYRAFAEFDRFDDQRCEAYIAYMHRTPGNHLALAKVILLFTGLAGMFVCVGLSAVVSDWLKGFIHPSVTPFRRDEIQTFYLLACIASSWFALMLGLLTVRDLHLRSVLRRQLRGVRCQVCSYSLLGMPVVEGVVQCPECGDKFTIALRGLREEDFKVGADELPGLDELVSKQPLPAKPYEHVMDPSEKERILSAVRERRGTLSERSTPPPPSQG